MATATAPKIVRGKDGPVTVVDGDQHKQEMATLRAEQESRREEMLKLCNPKYAAEVEAKKPVFQWRVEFRVIERKTTETPAKVDRYADNGGDDDPAGFKFRKVTKTVTAQCEAEAWSRACDLLGEYPSPKIAKPRFTKLKQIKL